MPISARKRKVLDSEPTFTVTGRRCAARDHPPLPSCYVLIP